MRQHLIVALRDNIVVYIIVAPVLMALMLKLLVPAAERSHLLFAVDRAVSPEVVGRLREYGDVELFERGGVISRVERPDAAAGVLDDEGRLCLVLEGNEPRELVETYEIILEDINHVTPVAEFREERLSSEGWFVLDLVTVGLIMAALFFCGTVSGFTIVAERDTKVIRALAVSPTGVSEYAAARGLLATMLAAAVVVMTGCVMVGRSADVFRLLALVAFSAPLTTLVGLLTGMFAHNQITAIALLKIAMPLYLAVPLGSTFVPGGLRFLFYALPNYWQLEALKAMYAPSLVTRDFMPSMLLTALCALPFLALAAGKFGKHVGLCR
jgi:hypothetical protein